MDTIYLKKPIYPTSLRYDENQTYDIPSGKTYVSLVVLLADLFFLYVIGIFGASNNPLEFLSVTFLLILSVGSRTRMRFSPTIWVSGSKTYLFHLCSYNDVRSLFNKSTT